jgi:hypothetical protein
MQRGFQGLWGGFGCGLWAVSFPLLSCAVRGVQGSTWAWIWTVPRYPLASISLVPRASNGGGGEGPANPTDAFENPPSLRDFAYKRPSFPCLLHVLSTQPWIVCGMDSVDIAHRFAFHPATTEQRQLDHGDVRRLCLDLAERLNDLLPEGREKSLAITNLEQVMFWANAGVARA